MTPSAGRRRRIRERVGLLLGAAAYVAVFNWTYIEVVSPAFSYLGYVYNPPDPFFAVASWLLAILPSTWLSPRLTRPSQVVYWILYVAALVPATLVPFYATAIEPGRLLGLALVLVALFGLLGAIYRLPLARLRAIRTERGSFWLVVALLSAVVAAGLVSVFGLQLDLARLTDVYETRSEYKETLAHGGNWVAYVVGWQANAIHPLLIAQGLVAKNPLLLAVGGLGQLLIYSITGFKSVLFSGLLVLGILISLQREGRGFGFHVLCGAVGLILISVLADAWLGSIVPSSLFVRRTFVTPGLVTGYYFEFFSANPKAMLADSILGSLLPYPYEGSLAQLVGAEYFGNPENSANANIWANAYAQFGYLGMLAFTIVLGGVLWLFDSVAAMGDRRLASAMLAVFAITLCNSGLLTSLLTHGIGVGLLVLYLVPGPREQQGARLPETPLAYDWRGTG